MKTKYSLYIPDFKNRIHANDEQHALRMKKTIERLLKTTVLMETGNVFMSDESEVEQCVDVPCTFK